MQRHKNITSLCQNLAVMYSSFHYSLFLLTSLCLEYWHRNCLRDPALSKYLWVRFCRQIPESPISLERPWPNPNTLLPTTTSTWLLLISLSSFHAVPSFCILSLSLRSHSTSLEIESSWFSLVTADFTNKTLNDRK